MGLVQSVDFKGDNLNDNNDAALSLDYATGGLYIEYIFNLESPIHFSIPINFMGGEILVHNAISETEVESSGVFVIEPGICLELNVSKNFYSRN